MSKIPDRVSKFGARLSAFRKAAGYTQVELSAALDTFIEHARLKQQAGNGH